MTKYERDLRSRLRDSEKWPAFEQPGFLERLDGIAGRAIQKHSVEAKLAAILIYHQLVEEMFRLLIQDSQLLVQAALRPRRIDFPAHRRQMFGQLQQDLRDSVHFAEKNRLLALSEEINAIRIDVVHKLTNRGSLAGLARDARKAKRLYERIFLIFEEVHDGFRVYLHGFSKDLL
jgi:hypothetical protein